MNELLETVLVLLSALGFLVVFFGIALGAAILDVRRGFGYRLRNRNDRW
jgi:hypothetical protein